MFTGELDMNIRMTRTMALLFMLTGLLHASTLLAEALPRVTVYKSPTCGCCKKWIAHLQDNGFTVQAHDMQDTRSIKSISGIRQEYASCHTATVGGYVVEGHVPAGDIKRLLNERPRVRGLTVPGMPMGSPGMEGPRKDKYQVLTYDKSGIIGVYASH